MGARLPVVFTVSGASIDLLVDAGDDATVDDLVRALAGGEVAGGTELTVDGRRVPGSALVADAGVRAGSVLALGSSGPRVPVTVAAEVHVVGGLDAGVVCPLPPGRHTVGRGRHADVQLDAPTLSRLHLVVDVDPHGAAMVHDAGSTNGTRVAGAFVNEPTAAGAGDELALGAVALRIAPAGTTPASRRAPGAFNRPPRREAAGATRPPLVAPRPRPPVTARPRFSWTGLLVPLVAGGAMAVLWDPRLAAFCLLSPVLVAGTWLEERRRAKRDGRDRVRDLEAEVERFRADVAQALAREASHRARHCPDPADVVRRATSADTQLWQRRAREPGAFAVRLGTGDERWVPAVDGLDMADEAAAVLRDAALTNAPITADLAPGSMLGIAGDRRAAVSVARWVVAQLAVHLGPADVRIAVLTGGERVEEWSFAKWLPHAAGLVASTAVPTDVDAVVDALHAHADVARVVIADAPGLATGKAAPLRALLAGGHGAATGVVLASHEEELPASCTHVLVLDGSDGSARLHEPATGRVVDSMLATGLAPSAAAAIAHALAPVDDPEASGDHHDLPPVVHLLPLLDVEPDASPIAARWQWSDGMPTATLGTTARGPLTVDLVRDGPHGLVGGTTGAGKSELLRTFVASLAANTSPADVNVVLVDYKGGSAFDACARLPHVVGLVTDLDEHLGRRALRCLEAELRHRESVLRATGAADISSHHLPRLVVVIDEFATLAAELPDFMDALVGIAQRGRSLGVHLVLATQRPAGAVKDNIRANTNLRVALRMQDAADSNDVIGSPDAARITRDQRGRGLARLGPSELVAFQAALVSGRSAIGGPSRAVVVRPFPFAPSTDAATATGAGDGPSDLERLVDAARAAAAQLGIPPQRQPWPDPLPASVDLAGLDGAPAGGVLLGLADDPSRQCRRSYGWDPLRGNLLVYGVAGSGTTTVLETIAVSLARSCSPERLHLYAMDFGAGRLASLAALPHTGAVVGATEDERQRRLVRLLRNELDRRRASHGDGNEWPAVVLLLDGWSAFTAAYDDADGMALRDEVARLVADGPAVGMWTVVTAEVPNALPLSVAGLVAQRLVLRLADRSDWSAFGVGRHDVPPELPGRGIDVASGLEVQVAFASPVARGMVIDGPRCAPGIGTLPTDVRVCELRVDVTDDGVWRIPIGLDDTSLSAAVLPLHPGDHAVIAGPPRSGRSTALETVIAAARTSRPEVDIAIVAPRRSPLHAQPSGGVPRYEGRPLLVIVDDCELVDDGDGAIAALLRADHPDVHVIAAGRSDALRSGYGHWSRELRRSRLGIALVPQVEDGDLFGTVFARRSLPVPVVGRGLLVVDGVASTVQVARP